MLCTFDWTFAGKHALLWPRRGALGSRSDPDRDWRDFRWCKHRDRRGAEPGAGVFLSRNHQGRIYGRMRPGPNGAGLSRRAIMAEIDASLQRLGTETTG